MRFGKQRVIAIQSQYFGRPQPLQEHQTYDGQVARARSTWIYLVRGGEGEPTLAKVGHYEDDLVREDGEWRFARRHAPMDMGVD